jgi:vacuolar-type H+-ATPase subunit I/STV1
MSIYQTTWENQSTLLLRDSTAGAEVEARVGQGFDDGDSFWYIADVVRDGDVLKALFQQYKGNSLVSMRKLAARESLGPYTLLEVTQRLATGLRVVSDPGFVTVIVGVALLAFGLALTFIQKRREEGA